MAKRRITAEEISVGDELPWDAYDGEGRLLLRKGQVVASDGQIERLIDQGLFAEADPTHDKHKQEIIEPPVEEARSSALASILEARRRLQAACMSSAPKEKFVGQLAHIRGLIQEAFELNPHVALATVLLDHEGRYSVRHSVDAATICHAVGTALELKETELAATVMAALTMNISILRLQDALQSNRGSLTPAQREAIQQHPQQSAEALRQRGVTDAIWLGAVLDHHEAYDGSGYPAHKKGNEIPLPSRLVSLADIYCARVSGRDYRQPLRPHAALRGFVLSPTDTVDKGLVTQFIKAIGVFPPGTPVRLENGEIAIVTRPGEKANTPQVSAVIGPRGARLAVPIKRDTSLQLYSVRDVAQWHELGAAADMQALWGKGAAL